ncbi:MAG: BatA domain-containing protein [archaeon]
MNILGYIIEITNPLGFFTFFSIAILLLLYFLKPKPFKKVIPSLIFLETQKKKSTFSSFFHRFTKDWLMLLQLMILLMLCFSCLKMFTYLNIYVRSGEVVCVIDASASSKVIEEGKTRFEKSVKACENSLGDKNSIILVKGVPNLLAKQVSYLNAKRLLGTVKSTDSLSPIWEGMLMAADTASTSQAKIVVASDFLDTSGKDTLVARDILASKGFIVHLVNVASEKKNLGIINYERINGTHVSIEVKNYNKEPETVSLSDISGKKEIAGGSIGVFETRIKEGLNTFNIENKDDFEVDNKIVINYPQDEKTKVLIITNKKNTYVQKVLTSISSIKTDFAEPPIVPSLDYDIIVIDSVNKNQLISGMIDNIREQVVKGSSVIIVPQDDLAQIDFKGLLPVSITNHDKSSVPIINTKQVEEFTDINFGQSLEYFDAVLVNNNSIIIAETIGKSPIITQSTLGEGKIIYYGIFDSSNNFRLSTDYPVFWFEIVRKLSKRDEFSNLNRKIGDIIYADGSDIVSPNGKKSTDYIKAEETGVYKAGEREIAVNLLNPAESRISFSSDDKVTFESSVEQKKTSEYVDLTSYFVYAAIFFLFIEMIYIKIRGEI